ncbi:MAG: TPM domain-containing protein [Butyrivibrio sp.]
MHKKLATIAISVLVILLFITFPANIYAQSESVNSDTGYEVIIEDDAGLLTDEEKEMLADVMYPITTDGSVIFKSISSNSGKTSSFARRYYHEVLDNGSGTLFLIDMDNREIYIFSDGYVNTIITKTRANTITDNVYRYASYGEYYQCASNAYEQIITLLAGGRIAQPMKHVCNVLLALIAAFIVNFAIVKAATKQKEAGNTVILDNISEEYEAGTPVKRLVDKKRAKKDIPPALRRFRFRLRRQFRFRKFGLGLTFIFKLRKRRRTQVLRRERMFFLSAAVFDCKGRRKNILSLQLFKPETFKSKERRKTFYAPII